MNDALFRCKSKKKYDKVLAFLIKVPKNKLVEFVLTGKKAIPYQAKEFDVDHYIKSIQLELDFAELKELDQLIGDNLALAKKYIKNKEYSNYRENNKEWEKLNKKYNSIQKRIDKNLNLEGEDS